MKKNDQNQSELAEKNLATHLQYLQLPYIREHFNIVATQAASKEWSHVRYLENLVEGEALQRQDRAIQRLIKKAHFPVIKTLDPFRWNWPEKINRMQVQNLFRLAFIGEKSNVILLGGRRLGENTSLHRPGICRLPQTQVRSFLTRKS